VPWDRLSVADATFLALDSPTTPMNIGTILILEGDALRDEAGCIRLDLVRAHTEARLHRARRNRQRLVRVPGGLGRPVWVDDPAFDIDDHFAVTTLPTPTRTALLELAADHFMVPFDPTRPLWSWLFVDGLPDGQIAVLIKVHHCVLDGGSGLEAFQTLFAPTPEVAPPDPPVPWTPRPDPAPRRLVGDALRHQAGYLRTMGAYAGRALRAPVRAARRAQRISRSLGPFSRVGRGVPRLSFNRPVGARRRIATVPLPLDDLMAVRAAVGCTVNDVLLAVVAGGVRRLLAGRDELAPGTEVTLMFPVSVRRSGDQVSGNALSGLVVTTALTGTGPGDRLAAVHAQTARAKAEQRAADFEVLVEFMDCMTPAMLGVAAWSMHNQNGYNVSVSNLASVPVPVWYLGARLLEFYPIAPLMHHLGIMVTAFSHAGTMFVGIHADADLVPDVDVFATGMAAELTALRSGAAPPAGRRTEPAGATTE
jgi:diacylglycerol O-acyltransferase